MSKSPAAEVEEYLVDKVWPPSPDVRSGIRDSLDLSLTRANFDEIEEQLEIQSSPPGKQINEWQFPSWQFQPPATKNRQEKSKRSYSPVLDTRGPQRKHATPRSVAPVVPPPSVVSSASRYSTPSIEIIPKQANAQSSSNTRSVARDYESREVSPIRSPSKKKEPSHGSSVVDRPPQPNPADASSTTLDEGKHGSGHATQSDQASRNRWGNLSTKPVQSAQGEHLSVASYRTESTYANKFQKKKPSRVPLYSKRSKRSGDASSVSSGGSSKFSIRQARHPAQWGLGVETEEQRKRRELLEKRKQYGKQVLKEHKPPVKKKSPTAADLLSNLEQVDSRPVPSGRPVRRKASLPAKGGRRRAQKGSAPPSIPTQTNDQSPRAYPPRQEHGFVIPRSGPAPLKEAPHPHVEGARSHQPPIAHRIPEHLASEPIAPPNARGPRPIQPLTKPPAPRPMQAHFVPSTQGYPKRDMSRLSMEEWKLYQSIERLDRELHAIQDRPK